MSAGGERGRFSPKDTIHASSINRIVYRCGDLIGYAVRVVFRYQGTRHSYFLNHGVIVDGYERGVYRSHIIHYPSHNPGGIGRLYDSSVSSFRVHKSAHGNDRGLHMSHPSHRTPHNRVLK